MVPVFSESDRKHGEKILIISIIAVALWITYRLLR
jgi:hypothetical protein